MKDRVDDIRFLLLVGEYLRLSPYECTNRLSVEDRFASLDLDKKKELADCFGVRYVGEHGYGLAEWRKSGHPLTDHSIASFVSEHMKKILT